MTSRPIRHERGVFASLSDGVLGPVVDLSDLQLELHPPARIELARRVWAERVRTELRSVQIMNRFLGEVIAAGDPIEVYAGAADLVVDELRHVRLTVALCEALGGTPVFPDPIELREPDVYTRAPAAERALHTAIAMLCVSETLSVAFIEDLRARCGDPAVKRVLDATLDDEETHHAFGWSYVEKALTRFPASTRDDWRELVRRTLDPHRRATDPILARLDAAGTTLADLPEPELAAQHERLSLLREEAERRAIDETLAPRLRALDLLS